MVFLGIFLLLFVFVQVRLYLYIEASKLKITEDIRASDSILLQKEFGIDLPPEAEIISFGYSEELIVFRIDGVTDLEAFFTEALPLEIDVKEAQRLSDLIHRRVDENINQAEDTEETESWLLGFYFYEYQSDSNALTRVDFLLVNGDIIIEISDTYFVTENRARFREIVNR